jgi:hypothetical protein
VSQYTVQFLLPRVAKLIDDLHYENFHMPVRMHQNRLVKPDANGPRFVATTESDYVDAQEQCDYVDPNFPLRDGVSPTDGARLDRIAELLNLALNGKNIPVAKLKIALTASEFAEFSDSVASVVEQSEIMYGDGMPKHLKSYNVKLNAADLMWARYEAMSPVAPHGSKRKTRPSQVEDRAESLYEDALENLEEMFGCAERGDWGMEMIDRLHRWMDRSIDFDAGFDRTLAPDVHAMPRVRGSKSRYAVDSGLPKLSKRIKRQLCALHALLVACCEIAFVVPYPQPVVVSAAQKQVLKSKLADLMKKIKN